MKNICIGIVSYLPDDKEIRRVRSQRVTNLVKDLDTYFKLPIILVSQNYQDFSLHVNHSKLIQYKYKNKLGFSGAREILRKIFINSEYTHMILFDDDVDIVHDQKAITSYLNEIYQNTAQFYYRPGWPEYYCCFEKEAYKRFSYKLDINPERGTGWEGIVCYKWAKKLKCYEIKTKIEIKNRKEYITDYTYSTWLTKENVYKLQELNRKYTNNR